MLILLVLLHYLQLVTMASDSDGSAALVQAIRERLVAYKGQLERWVQKSPSPFLLLGGAP